MDADLGGALGPILGQSVVGDRGPVDVDRVAADEVLGGGVQVVALEIRDECLGVQAQGRLAPGRAVLGHSRGSFEQLGLILVQLGLHVVWLLSRAAA